MLEGARLLLNAGVPDEVVGLLEQCSERLIEQGFAPRLWQLLELSPDERLSRWLLQCAVALGQPALLSTLKPPTELEPEVRLLWARGLLIQGRSHEALERATVLRGDGERCGDGGLAFDAGLLAARCLALQLRPDQAVSLLEGLEPPDAATRTLRESLVGYCLAISGQVSEAVQRIQVLQQHPERWPASVQSDVMLNTARVMLLANRARESYAASASVLSSSLPSIGQLMSHFQSSMLVGRYEEAGHTLRRLEPFCSAGSYLRPMEIVYSVYFQLYVGELAVAAETITRWIPELKRLGESYRLFQLQHLDITCRMLRAEPPVELVDPGECPVELANLHQEIVILHAQVRAGVPLPDSFSEVHENASLPEYYHLLAGLPKVEAMFLQGAGGAALDLCHSLVQELNQRGNLQQEVEYRLTRCDLLLALGRWEALAEAAGTLSRLASAMPSPRFVNEAHFFEAVLPSKPVDWGQLERLASLIDVAPIAARRARVLLGGDALLDAVDRKVLAGLLEHRGVLPAQVLRSSVGQESTGRVVPWQPEWGLADEGCRVWRSDGSMVSLADRPQLWNILVSLYHQGGAATKEQLVQDIWHESEYHPLHHDHRLHVAVRKLRQQIEAWPSTPSFLLTTPHGYALTGLVRRVASAT